MRTFRLLACLLVCAGCDDDGAEPRDAGPEARPSQRTLTYTPAGCDYAVSTPEVNDTGMSADVFTAGELLDHVHVSWAGPTHTSFAVNWRSGRDTLASSVLWGTDRAAVEAADGPGGGVALQVGHHMLYRGLAPTGTRVHEVHVCGLSPSTTYFYKVGGPGHWSAVFDTSTAPEPGSTERFVFGVTGDSRNNVENAWPLSQKRFADAGIDFEVFSGDAVFLGPNQADWDLFFDASADGFPVQDLLARVPFMMANGNHDALAVNYVAQFAYPQQTSPGELAQGEEWYSFDYGNAHFVMLNDTVADLAVIAGAQAQWLREDLQRVDRERTPWVFAVHHQPLYTCRSNHAPNTTIREAWQPIFDEFAVDVVFNGHNHAYERTRPIRGLQAGEGVLAATAGNGLPTYDANGVASGTIYVVAAGVGAPLYDVSTDCPTSFTGEVSRPYVVIEIDGRRLEYTAYDTMTGLMIDTFALTK